ncbi:hypothetical protein NDU88_003454 [Pleurodeles waltl]|uniref:Uncharacterized protein n=1 Tax=Pleurodeles waltl TaxID=8319 RepID=A0AAV7WSE4_PLEWA|nr:hypothetical protein NDU88_003454 [Pleurodeles waltl]
MELQGTRPNPPRSGRLTGPSPASKAAASSELPRPVARGRQHGNTNRAPPPALQEHPINQSSDMEDASQGATMDHVLQEISAVGRRLEGMDSRMISQTKETKSMRLDIAGFQSRVTTLEQRVTTVETQATLAADREQELLYLCSKVIDLEDRSRRDNGGH